VSKHAHIRPEVIPEGQTHPPSAHKRVLIDFDGTIVPWVADLMGEREPYDGVALAMRALDRRGYEIIIFTSRVSPTWCASVNSDVLEPREYVETILDAYNIPFKAITAEKLPAAIYFDDKAIRVEPGYLANDIRDFINSQEKP
jgi:hypothetical protein